MSLTGWFIKRKILLLPALLMIRTGFSQLCSGMFSDPVVTINFGAGNNPGNPLPQVPSAYQYTSADCPAEGSYAVRNATFLCFSSNWHAIPFDHTPSDPNGYFLLINALRGPSDIYVDTIRSLCANTVFELSVWEVNVLNPAACSGNGINPNLTLSVLDLNGSVLGQINSSDISENQPYLWVQQRLQFRTPVNSGDVIIKITSNAANGCGNEFAIDDITLRPCGGILTAAFATTSSTIIDVCESDQMNYQMNATIGSGYTNPIIQWQVSYDGGANWAAIPGANGTSYIRPPASAGDYAYRFSVRENNAAASACIFNSNILGIQVLTAPFAQATNYVFGCYGSTIAFFAAGGSSYEWTGPNGFYSTSQGPEIPNVNFSHAGLYKVKVSNSGGCFSYDSTDLVIYPAPVAILSPVQASLCEGDSVRLNAGGSLRYQWDPPMGLSSDTIAAPFAKPAKTTTYTVKVYNEHTCYDTASVKIIVWEKPEAFAGPDKIVLKGRTVQMESGVKGSDVSYSWSPPDYLDHPSLVRPKTKPPETIVYKLTVVSNKGCGISTDDVKVEVVTKMFIPTGFTPNNDGLNDKWFITAIEDYPHAVIEVFNRWGQKLYTGYGKNYQPWDGTYNKMPVSPGTYVYQINLHNNTAVLKGTVTLIR